MQEVIDYVKLKGFDIFLSHQYLELYFWKFYTFISENEGWFAPGAYFTHLGQDWEPWAISVVRYLGLQFVEKTNED